MTELGAEDLVGGVPAMGSPNVPTLAPEGGEVQILASGWRLALREFLSNRLAVVGLADPCVLRALLLLRAALLPHESDVSNPLVTDGTPGATHLLGTDDNGFDELGRIMVGGQTALEIGFFAALMATVDRHALRGDCRSRRRDRRRGADALRRRPAVDPAPLRRACPRHAVQRDRRLAELDHRPLLVARSRATRARRGADAARAGLRRRGARSWAHAGDA